MPDEIVATSIGCKLQFGGAQWGTAVTVAGDVRDQLALLAEAKAALMDKLADQLQIAPGDRGADWAAQFRWIVVPLMQADLVSEAWDGDGETQIRNGCWFWVLGDARDGRAGRGG